MRHDPRPVRATTRRPCRLRARRSSHSCGHGLGALSRSGARGQSIVEFALAIPIFLALLFGTLEMGMLFKTRAAYQEAALEAVRVAAAAGQAGDADLQTLAELQQTLAVEDLSKITRVTIFKATNTGGYSATPNDNCVSSPCDNLHTTYIYNPSFVTATGRGAFVCAYITPATQTCNTPANAQSYWAPISRNVKIAPPGPGLDRIGIEIDYNYQGVTGLLPTLHLSETATAQIEPISY